MEHNHKVTAPAVVVRFIKRKWRLPLRITGAGTALVLVLGFAPFGHKTDARNPMAGKDETVSGVVESLSARGVGSAFDGIVEKVAVRPGQKIHRGDPLFRMDTTALKAELEAAQREQHDAALAVREAVQKRDEELSALRQQIADAALPARQVIPQDAMPISYDADSGAEQVVTVTPSASDVQYRLAGLRAQVQERMAAWEPYVKDAAGRYETSVREVERLKGLLANAERRSPMDGVVTAVNAGAGRTVAAGSTVVRVDNPSGYRVVTLVDQYGRERLKPGATLPLQRPDGTGNSQCEKIVSGWDSDLFHYWVWLKPGAPTRLQPGQTVTVTIPAPKSAKPAAVMASR
jgi:multidrug efflux pump subunit AcrA (membrane-fusion protein)